MGSCCVVSCGGSGCGADGEELERGDGFRFHAKADIQLVRPGMMMRRFEYLGPKRGFARYTVGGRLCSWSSH